MRRLTAWANKAFFENSFTDLRIHSKCHDKQILFDIALMLNQCLLSDVIYIKTSDLSQLRRIKCSNDILISFLATISDILFAVDQYTLNALGNKETISSNISFGWVNLTFLYKA